ncbi:GMC family oxidoreductase [Modestobacter sp. VKM Ac-2978]|uniref:GMC family oxidoreductase n=1 Tax=Modestobacter sp. VKM Ac-2978 TaxID=3004132 RepID=UPI0022AB3758|nr:GMC oxidoreductase [Modestobacter sp. VKM Ac-2978]MCZ2849835.1 GMC family oxidoreductase N-terminal domain-containing protein [Modestobacter sp. VKM Ac-2978]
MTEYDYLVVGGGTAGCLVAARLAEDRDVTVALLEWGPDDRGEDRASSLRRWAEMLEGEYDLDYRSVPQSRGNSGIRQARMRLLGGCSNANTMISWRPLPGDLREWVTLGAAGWDPETVLPYYDRLRTPIQPVAPQDRNPYVADVVTAAAAALDVPVRERWNDGSLDDRAEGTGFFEVGYTPSTNQRASTSHHYLHPVMDALENLTVVTGVQAERLLLDDGRAVGVQVRGSSGSATYRASHEVIVSCGAIDSVKLLQVSGIGPREVLERAGVPVQVDLPGVGENLQDHAEGLIVWEARAVPPSTCASGWDAGAMLSVDGDPERPDVLMHFPVEPWADHAVTFGAQLPDDILSIAPNVARPASRGRVSITSADPAAPPSIDYGYFTDPDGHDERMLVAGVRAARSIAEQEPFRSWLVREVFPGPDVTSDNDLSRVLRATHQTVYHVSGTCRMGADDDPLAVLDPTLRVRGVAGLRVVDASVFPTIPSVNPVATIMVVAERAADLIAQDRAAEHPASA